jgi:hypothetical protein
LVLFFFDTNEIIQSAVKVFVDVFGKAGEGLIVVAVQNVEDPFEIALVDSPFGGLVLERLPFLFGLLG